MPPKQTPARYARQSSTWQPYTLFQNDPPTTLNPPFGRAIISLAVRNGPPPNINVRNVLLYGRGPGGHRRRREYDGFPASDVILPDNITSREVFRYYPNHVTDDHVGPLMDDGLNPHQIEALYPHIIRLARRPDDRAQPHSRFQHAFRRIRERRAAAERASASRAKKRGSDAMEGSREHAGSARKKRDPAAQTPARSPETATSRSEPTTRVRLQGVAQSPLKSSGSYHPQFQGKGPAQIEAGRQTRQQQPDNAPLPPATPSVYGHSINVPVRPNPTLPPTPQGVIPDQNRPRPYGGSDTGGDNETEKDKKK